MDDEVLVQGLLLDIADVFLIADVHIAHLTDSSLVLAETSLSRSFGVLLILVVKINGWYAASLDYWQR